MAKEWPEHGIAVQQQLTNQRPHAHPADHYAAQRAHFGQFCRDVLHDLNQQQQQQQPQMPEEEAAALFSHVYQIPL